MALPQVSSHLRGMTRSGEPDAPDIAEMPGRG